MDKDFTAIFKGGVAEQFAGQELIAYQSCYSKAELYYWGRDARNSSAEVDYILEKNARIIPVEVKAGATGRMKSLLMFIDIYKSETALKISQAPYNSENTIVKLPFYAIEGFMK